MDFKDFVINFSSVFAYFFIRLFFFLLVGGIFVAPALLLTVMLAVVSWVLFVNTKRHDAKKTKQIKWIILAVIGTAFSVVLIIISIYLWNVADPSQL